ncbi:MAG: TonB-dependent receptor [Rhodobacteraceae bacterium]|nr:TonB-dependent receptor [Paracoccaceae bacterium]
MALCQPLAAQMAEPSDPRDPPGNEEKQEIATPGEAIVVTGTRIKGAPVAGQVMTIDRTTIEAAGQIDLGEALRSLPQNFSGGQNPGIGNGAGLANANVNSASSANLRGLGTDATLTLLNGHRLPYDSAFQGVDISAIPLAALDRIEILPDGASALYGSDAVAGVVNVLLRRDMEGVATSGQIGAGTQGGYFRQQADITGGAKWHDGGFLLAYGFAHNSQIEARQRSYAGSLEPDTTLYPSQTLHSVILSGHQRAAGNLEFQLDALYSRRRSVTKSGPAGERYLARPEVDNFTIAPSLRLELGGDWEASLAASYGEDRTHYATSITPTGGSTSVTSGCFCNSMRSLEFGTEGPLIALPGGDARIALGAGLRSNGMDFSRYNGGAVSDAFNVSRRSRFGYAELFLPLVSPRNAIGGIDRLSVTAAVRYEAYSGLDSQTTPRLGLIYSPVPELTLHGNWSRSFKAPTLYQQYILYETYLLPAAIFGAGTGADTVMYVSGGNPGLDSERARSWTAGFEFRPRAIPGLTLEASWYDIRYKDRVVTPIDGSLSSAFSNPGYASLLDFSPSADQLSQLIAGAQLGLQNYTGAPYDPANVVTLIDNRFINVAAQSIRGIDAHLTYGHGFGEGKRLTADIAASWLDSSQQLTEELPRIALAGTVFNPAKFRLRASASLALDRLRVTSALNVMGALKDERFDQTVRIAPSATVDIGVSFDIIPGKDRDTGLSVDLTIQNLFDRKPSPIGTTGPTDTPYDSTNYSPIGRFVAIGIRRHW